MNLGFVGLGAMGLPMTRHLVEARHRVTVSSRNARNASSRCEPPDNTGREPSAAENPKLPSTETCRLEPRLTGAGEARSCESGPGWSTAGTVPPSREMSCVDAAGVCNVAGTVQNVILHLESRSSVWTSLSRSTTALPERVLWHETTNPGDSSR